MPPRNSQRVDRRRRVLVDESRNEGPATRPRIFRGDTDGPTCRYNHAALAAINAPIAKYIPLRPYSLMIWFLGGLLPVMGLLLLDQQRVTLAGIVGHEATRSLDLAAPGSVAGWISSLTFGFAVVLMLGVYSVRRHRRDDYRGSFTVWGWAMTVAILVSIDAGVSIHTLWQGLCELATGTTLWGDGSIWWIGAWTILGGSIILRLLFEMASSKQAVGWALAASGCYASSALIELNVGELATWQGARAAQFATLMLGHHLMLFSLVHYAREVVLEAMGLIDSPAVRQANAAEEKAKKSLAAQAAASDKVAARHKAASDKAVAVVAAAKTKTKKTAKPTASTSLTAATTSAEHDQQTEHQKTENRPQLRAVVADDEDDTELAPPTKSKHKSRQEKPTLKAVHHLEEDEESYDYDDDDDGDGSQRKLSKAEKRRLRKEEKRRKAA